MHKRLSIPHRLQIEIGYCHPACVEMVLAYWGIEANQKNLAHKMQTISGVGTPGPNIQRLSSRHLSIVYDEGSLEDLRRALEMDIPPIALVRTRELPYWNEDTPHAVVVTGFENDILFVNDPAIETPNIHVPDG